MAKGKVHEAFDEIEVAAVIERMLRPTLGCIRDSPVRARRQPVEYQE
ncbi:MAG: hypothetical protein ACLQRH_18035 [Acidimicrobiales bacterium]